MATLGIKRSRLMRARFGKSVSAVVPTRRLTERDSLHQHSHVETDCPQAKTHRSPQPPQAQLRAVVRTRTTPGQVACGGDQRSELLVPRQRPPAQHARVRRSPKLQGKSGQLAPGSSRPTLRTQASAGHPSQSSTGRDKRGGAVTEVYGHGVVAMDGVNVVKPSGYSVGEESGSRK